MIGEKKYKYRKKKKWKDYSNRKLELFFLNWPVFVIDL